MRRIRLSIRKPKQMECALEEINDLVMCAFPGTWLVVENQERIDIERRVHLNIEVEPVRSVRTLHLELFREPHLISFA